MKKLIVPGVIAGVLLHAYTCFFVPEGGPDVFTSGLFVLSVLPYLVCLLAGMKKKRGQWMAVCAIVPLFLLDSVAFHTAILAPTSSTSSLTLLVVPFLKFMILLLGFFVGWMASRGRSLPGGARPTVH